MLFSKRKKKKWGSAGGVRGGKAAVWARQPLSKGWDLSFQYLNLIICLRQNYIPFQLPLPYSKLFQFKTNLVKLGHWWIIVRCSYLEAEFTLEKSLEMGLHWRKWNWDFKRVHAICRECMGIPPYYTVLKPVPITYFPGSRAVVIVVPYQRLRATTETIWRTTESVVWHDRETLFPLLVWRLVSFSEYPVNNMPWEPHKSTKVDVLYFSMLYRHCSNE